MRFVVDALRVVIEEEWPGLGVCASARIVGGILDEAPRRPLHATLRAD